MTFANLHIIDWGIVLIYMGFILYIGLKFTGKAGSNMTGFFLSGRSLPWWLAGTSAIAGHFSCSYPIKTVTMVREYGIEHVWMQWYMIPATMLGAVFLAKLWRRSRIITVVEIVRVRYSGVGVHILTAFRALYEGIFMKCYFIAASLIALESIIAEMLPGTNPFFIIFGICLIALVYSIMSGLYAVVITDFIQFIFAGIGSLVIVIAVYTHVGSPAKLVEEVQAIPGKETATHLIPDSPSAAAARPIRYYLFKRPILEKPAMERIVTALKGKNIAHSVLVDKYILLEDGAHACEIRTALFLEKKLPESFSAWNALGLGNWETDIFVKPIKQKMRMKTARNELIDALRVHLIAINGINDARVDLSKTDEGDLVKSIDVQLRLDEGVTTIPEAANSWVNTLTQQLGIEVNVTTPSELVAIKKIIDPFNKDVKAWLDYISFLLFIFVLWFFSGDLSTGGGDPQRILAARSERDSMLMLIFSNIIERGLIFWLWIIIALGSLVLLGGNAYDHQNAYAAMGMEFLPIGIKGVFVASIFAALMSTVDTNINTAASYMVNDIYKLYFNRKGSDKHYVKAARVATALSLLIGFLLWACLLNGTKILSNFKLIVMLFSGGALAQFSHWFWWRINAWTIISAMVGAIFSSSIIKFVLPAKFELFQTYNIATEYWSIGLLVVVLFSTVCWVITTLLTKPSDMEKLKTFYKRVHPIGFWGPVRKELEKEGFVLKAKNSSFRTDVQTWLYSTILIYAFVFGIGKLLLGKYLLGIALMVVFGVFLYLMLKVASKSEWWYAKDEGDVVD